MTEPKAPQKKLVHKDNSELDPFEIEFLPQFKQNRGPRQPFVNQYGVVIGDHNYESEHSPLENWSEDTDPSVMAGDEWVHPYKDVGFTTAENRDYFEKGISPQSGVFMHPTLNAFYDAESEEKVNKAKNND
jgi:hypothetical protein